MADEDPDEKAESAARSGLREVAEFPHFTDISHGDLYSLSLKSNTTSLTHGLHRFPAKYIPQVPRWALREFGSGSGLVLDPFMGSGTTLLEASRMGISAYGLDIDPLARLIANAKVARYDVGRLESLSKPLRVAAGTQAAPFLPMSGVANVEHWFPPKSWKELSALFAAIGKMECSESERQFFLCVFSSILRWVSNADDQTQKTYVSGTREKLPPSVPETFGKHLDRALAGLRELEQVRGEGNVVVGDGNALSIPLAERSVDLVVTSPPYVDSVDYMYNFMLEYFWLGPLLGVPSRAEFNRRRRDPVGAKRPHARDGLPDPLRDLVDTAQLPAYRKESVVEYFSSMRSHFREAHRVMRENARYVLVVGNSQMEAGVIPVHECLLRLARDCGLHLEKAFAYRIRRHYMKFPRKGRGGIILMDWVITLRKTSKAILQEEIRLPIPDISIGDDEVAH